VSGLPVGLAVAVPAAAALLVGLLPGLDAKLARSATRAIALAELSLGAWIAASLDLPVAGPQLGWTWSWIPALAVAPTLWVDAPGLWPSLAAIAVFALVAFGGLEQAGRARCAALLGMQAGVLGVAWAGDVSMLILAWQALLTSMFVGWAAAGDPAAVGRATRWFVAAQVGAAGASVALLGRAVAHYEATGGTFALELGALAGIVAPAADRWSFAALIVAAAAVVPIVPLHRWMIDLAGRRAAPISVLVPALSAEPGLRLLAHHGRTLFPLGAAELSGELAWLAALGAAVAALAIACERDPARLAGYAVLAAVSVQLLGICVIDPDATAGVVLVGVGRALAVTAVGLALGERGAPVVRSILAPALVGVAALVPFVGAAGLLAVVWRTGAPDVVGLSAVGVPALIVAAAASLGGAGLLARAVAGPDGSTPGIASRGRRLAAALALGAALGIGLAPDVIFQRLTWAARAAAAVERERLCVVLAAGSPTRPQRIDALAVDCARPAAVVRRAREGGA
jgi:NADH:ubiquinone oxidoreductase subunit 4 (subunit M)